jgi:hypothetical protein
MPTRGERPKIWEQVVVDYLQYCTIIIT